MMVWQLKVHARVGTIAVGKLSLNLTGLSRESVSIFGHRINLAIQGLLPFSQSMPLTVEYLNTASLAPRKDNQTNRLIAGVLQLAQGTHLTIDETQLKTGMLNASRVENARNCKDIGVCYAFIEFEDVSVQNAIKASPIQLCGGRQVHIEERRANSSVSR